MATPTAIHAKLLEVSEEVKALGRLGKRREKLVIAAVGIMRNVQDVRAFQVYRSFLYDILRLGGRHMVVICAAGLGKNRVVQLNIKERTDLVRYVAGRRTFFDSPILADLAATLKVPVGEATPVTPSLNGSEPEDNLSSEAIPQSGQHETTVTSETPSTLIELSQDTEHLWPHLTIANPITEHALTGSVYGLSEKDVRDALCSREIQGQIWLTITYNANNSPFITIPISRKLSYRLAAQCPRMM
ncbi:hypothetical protein MauCBS54593_000250 [Microsporum audouinii]